MKLHPDAARLVKALINEGRAGQRPFGVPLAIWQAEIAKLSVPVKEGRDDPRYRVIEN